MDLFISDLHLDESRPEISRLFLEFLAGPALDANSLYILGDLFEFWIGDDHQSPMARMVAEGLHRLSKSAGVAVFFMAGNRDFLIGEQYALQAGLTLLQEPGFVDLQGRTALLCHGDLLCTEDHAYQAFRQRVRQSGWIQEFLAKPLKERLTFAQHAREESARHNAGKSAEIMDVTPSEVEQLMREYRVDLLIHGHTHRPAVHQLEIDGRRCQRIVLGDWYEQGSVLIHKNGELLLETLHI